MRIKRQNIERRAVIEAYAKYDCSKKGCATPAFATWDWSQADAIDKEMCRVHLKTGVPAGYLLWDEIELAVSDLCECAVDVKIFPGQSRRLGSVGAGELASWGPERQATWCKLIAGGQTFDETAPMMLRPAVSWESPACWYIEDGSGRAIAFVKNQHIFRPSQTVAIGYLGCKPDPDSSFMQREFRELLHE